MGTVGTVRGTVGAVQAVRWVLYGGTVGGARKVEGVRWVGYAFSPVASMNFHWEAGARVTMHTRLANLNVPAVQRVDNRTIRNGAAIAAWLPAGHRHHAGLAFDRCCTTPGTKRPVRRRNIAHIVAEQRAHIPELAGSNRCRLVVLAMEVGYTRRYGSHGSPWWLHSSLLNQLSVAMVSSHPSGHVSPKHYPPPLPPVDFQGGEGGSWAVGFVLLDYAHVETGHYKNSP